MQGIVGDAKNQREIFKQSFNTDRAEITPGSYVVGEHLQNNGILRRRRSRFSLNSIVRIRQDADSHLTAILAGDMARSYRYGVSAESVSSASGFVINSRAAERNRGSRSAQLAGCRRRESANAPGQRVLPVRQRLAKDVAQRCTTITHRFSLLQLLRHSFAHLIDTEWLRDDLTHIRQPCRIRIHSCDDDDA